MIKTIIFRIVIGGTEEPGPSMNFVPLGQEGHSRIQTSCISFDLMTGMDVSKAVSITTSVGIFVVSVGVACAVVDRVTRVEAQTAIKTLKHFDLTGAE